MKFFQGIICETMLISMLSRVDNISDLIKEFIAIEIIIQIDNMYVLLFNDHSDGRKNASDLIGYFNKSNRLVIS